MMKITPLGRNSLFVAMLMVVTLAMNVAQAQQAEWVPQVTQEVQTDFALRLDSVENDPTRKLGSKGYVTNSQLIWTPNSQPIVAQPGTVYYTQSPDQPNLDTVMVNSLSEAHSAYAAAMQSGQYAAVQIVHVQQGQNGHLDFAQYNGQEVPLLSYNTVEEIGSTENDFLAEKLFRQQLMLDDPTGALLAQYQQEEKEFIAMMYGEDAELTSGDNYTLVAYMGGRRQRRGQCQPCNMQRMPTCGAGGGYAMQQSCNAQGQRQTSYRQCQPRGRNQAYNGRGYFGGGQCESCNLGLLAGPKALFDGSFWRDRPRKQHDFMQLRFGQRLMARAFPRRAYRLGHVGCTTAKGLLGQRFLAILIGVSVGTAGGGGAAVPIFLGENEIEMPQWHPGSDSNPFAPPQTALSLVAANGNGSHGTPFATPLGDMLWKEKLLHTRVSSDPPELQALAA